ncbi:hypothetical protein LCGC14_2424360 [marine sediment metagenome]|uniref:Type I restriction enzyme R protein N-terminal domain-containing protein n=1 Tax=marine sediment metagenome TaxID=412755 RepID=A0A0F9BNS3_9ZZZZ
MQRAQLEKLVHGFLIEGREYPPESLLQHQCLPRDWKSGKYIPDIVIVEPSSKDIVGIVEVKAAGEIERGDTLDRCRRLATGLRDGDVPFFLVFAEPDNMAGSKVHQFVSEATLETTLEEFPPISSLSTIEKVQTKAHKRRDRKKTIDAFQWLSYGLAIVLFALLCLDLLRLLVWSEKHLMFIGAIVVLILAPHVSKLKMFGVEVERREDNQKGK